ncbi:MAG: O-antigen ligase family protein [Phycisphaerales bacterium]|nr:O-antigen ligase family protein [Phycisphaerales bacterium]
MNSAEHAGRGWRDRAVATGLGLVLIAVLVRMLSAFEPFPYWASDPFQMTTPTTGITPALSLVLDLAALLGAALVLAARGKDGPALWELLLWAMGAAAAGLHAAVIDGGSLDNLLTGSMWVAATASGLAARAAAPDRRLASFIGAALIGVSVLLAGKGVMQLLIEHPETLSAYRENKEAFLAAQGWTPGSAMTRAFERRLYQPEATGWFGLSNVYASVMAGASVILLGLTIGAWKARAEPDQPGPLSRRAVLVLLAIGCAAAAVGLAMSRSKGGFAAAIAGAAVMSLATLAPGLLAKRARLVQLLGIALPLAVLGLVAARGLIGERIGELSVLFRWFYIQGAARIFAGQPITGVGPGEFKDAYLLAKPPLSPEEVTSPHSIIFDYAATLGLGGLAWVGLLSVWMLGVGAALGPARGTLQPAAPASITRNEIRLLLLVAAAAMLIGAQLEQATATIEMTLLRLVCVAVWAAAGTAIMQVWRAEQSARACAIAFASGAIALAAHAQIEVTPVWPGSAAWVLMLIGLASGGPSAGGKPIRAVGAVVVAAAGAGIAIMLPGVVRWERALKDAAESARISVEVRERLAKVESGDEAERTTLAAELSQTYGRPVDENPAIVIATSQGYLAGLARTASDSLMLALQAQPGHFATARSLSRACLESSQWSKAAGRGDESRAARAQAEEVIAAFVRAHPESSAGWGWLGSLREGLADGRAEGLLSACEAWERAAALDPYGLEYSPGLARTYRTLGNTTKARAWAERALHNNDLHRLDPLQQLSPGEVQELRAIAAGG